MKRIELECLDKAICPTSTRKRNVKRIACYALFGATMALVPLRAWADSDNPGKRFIPRILVSSTIPATGDLNPYGVTFVPPGFPAGGPLSPGDILVSNFNNSKNLQGTGTTIIKLTPSNGAAPDTQAQVFFQGTTPGLTTALGVLTAAYRRPTGRRARSKQARFCSLIAMATCSDKSMPQSSMGPGIWL